MKKSIDELNDDISIPYEALLKLSKISKLRKKEKSKNFAFIEEISTRILDHYSPNMIKIFKFDAMNDHG